MESLWILIVASFGFIAAADKPPNIIFIVADDLGWNDLGFHGSNQFPTPNLDALAYSGIILNKYYVTPLCTPSRSALMTGKLPIHTGMQHFVLVAREPRGLPLTEKLLPQYLKELGYTNRAVGKWHLGHYTLDYTPMRRGFESHLGYWTGHHDYYDHTAEEFGYYGLDMRNGSEVAYNLHGEYSTDVFTKEAVRIIEKHNTSNPLFLYMAHAACHSGNNYEPLRAPDEKIDMFNNIRDYQRRKFAAITSSMDDSVGKVIEALAAKKMLSNSIIVFTTDNGGAAGGFNVNAASNWPLRGVKATLFEGGVRGIGLMWSPLIAKQNRVSNQVFQVTDWLPTLYHAAGGNPSDLSPLDGIDVWDALKHDLKTNRTEILHNIDDIYRLAGITVGDYKLIKGSIYNSTWDNWYGPSGRGGRYDIEQVLNSPAAKALSSVGSKLDSKKILNLRSEAKVHCGTKASMDQSTKCNATMAPCLFNIRTDPCEIRNLASELPEVLQSLTKRLNEYNATAVPPGNLPLDPRGIPALWNYTWANFGDAKA